MSELKQVAKQALSLMDLTSLNENDTVETIEALCMKANTQAGLPAAICIYPQFIAVAKRRLNELGIGHLPVATVTNFPEGSDDIVLAVMETEQAIQAGADEVDVVFPYRALIDGDTEAGFELVKQCKAACQGKLLKVIIEVGELKEEILIKQASRIAIEAGADFIKTSTGKVAVNATPEFARMMLETIKELGVEDRVGFKAAGGVKTAEDAQVYLDMAKEMFGDSWVTPQHYRFGASSLLSNLLRELDVAVVDESHTNY
ncbi:deoxyribose-phosphate aldolase [Vibrio sp.]|nr:deoxyribose-phosphate aldolase [Vibrio sp.]